MSKESYEQVNFFEGGYMKKINTRIFILALFALLFVGCSEKIDIDSLPKISSKDLPEVFYDDKIKILDIKFTENNGYEWDKFSLENYKKIIDDKKTKTGDVEFVFLIKLKNLSDKEINIKKYFDAKLMHNEVFYDITSYDIKNVEDLNIPANWTGEIQLMIKAPANVWSDVENVKKYIRINEQKYNLQIDFIDLSLTLALKQAIEQLFSNITNIINQFSFNTEDLIMSFSHIDLSRVNFKKFLDTVYSSIENLQIIQMILSDSAAHIDKAYKNQVLPLINKILGTYENIEDSNNNNVYNDIIIINRWKNIFVQIDNILSGI